MERRFCDNCLEEVSCSYGEELIIEEIDGIKIEYLEKFYRCENCGEKFYDDLGNYNVREANQKLREATNLITIKEIEEILDKYSIGKKPLSLVLGMGEVTIIRYLNGLNPSRENSDLLKNINRYPFLLELYLYANRDKISDIAFKRTLGKVAQLQLIDDCSKLYQCALYILKQSVDLTPLSLQKLLYFIQGFSTQLLDSQLFDTEAEAWIYGPVYTDIYNCFSYYKNNNIDYSEIFSSYRLELQDLEKALIDSVIASFGCYSGSMLVEMSHLTNPWIKAREGLEDLEHTSREIDYKELMQYFKNICKKYDIKNFSDISKYAEDLFLQAKNKKYKEE